jgi:polysaccharide export outer membrane protein
MRSLAIVAVLLSFAGGIGGQTLTDHNPMYHLEYSDSVTINFRYTPEFNQDVTVGPDGRTEVAGFGAILARGLTLDQFKSKILELSSKRLVRPEISLSLKNWVKPSVLVEGEVNTPGRVELHGDITVLDAIALAGGFRDSGAKSNVLLMRNDPDRGAYTRVVNLSQLINAHKLEEVPQLHAGDVLFVSTTKFSKLQQIAHLGAFGAIYNPIK